MGKKKQKKIHARENAKKKYSCKEEGKKKIHAEGRSNCDFSHVVKKKFVQRGSPEKQIPAQAVSEKKIRAS